VIAPLPCRVRIAQTCSIFLHPHSFLLVRPLACSISKLNSETAVSLETVVGLMDRPLAKSSLVTKYRTKQTWTYSITTPQAGFDHTIPVIQLPKEGISSSRLRMCGFSGRQFYTSLQIFRKINWFCGLLFSWDRYYIHFWRQFRVAIVANAVWNYVGFRLLSLGNVNVTRPNCSWLINLRKLIPKVTC
jgi:hypothetical protein